MCERERERERQCVCIHVQSERKLCFDFHTVHPTVCNLHVLPVVFEICFSPLSLSSIHPLFLHSLSPPLQLPFISLSPFPLLSLPVFLPLPTPSPTPSSSPPPPFPLTLYVFLTQHSQNDSYVHYGGRQVMQDMGYPGGVGQYPSGYERTYSGQHPSMGMPPSSMGGGYRVGQPDGGMGQWGGSPQHPGMGRQQVSTAVRPLYSQRL